MPLIICNPKISDAATLTASNEVSGMEVGRLQLLRPSLKWRSTSLTPNIVGNLGAQYSLRAVALLHTNADTDTTWRVRLAGTEANLTAAPDYDSGSVSFWPGGADLSSWATTHGLEHLSPAEAATWFRIDIDHSTSGSAYFEAARLIVAEGLTFSRVTYALIGGGPSFSEEVVETTDQGGEESPRPRRVRMSQGVRLGGLTKAEALGQLSVLRRDRGSSKDVLVLLDPDEDTYPMDYMLWGRMKDSGPPINQLFTGMWEHEMTIVEP